MLYLKQQLKYPLSITTLVSLLLLFSHYAQSESNTITAIPHMKAHGMAMHGELKYPADFTHFEYTSAKAQKGGSLRLASQGTFDSLNPFIAKGTAANRIGLLYDSLTVSSADEAFSRYGLVAETMEWAEDRSWIIFNMRPEARFHDGEPIVAEDVVYSFNMLMEKGSPVYKAYYADVKNVEALSKHRVKFSFKNNENRELALIVGELPIFPKHYWEKNNFSKTSLDIPVGSGPYTIKSFDPGRRITFERKKDYWAKDLPVMKNRYNFDEIQVDYYKDAVVLLEALKSFEYDFRLENSSKQWATGYTGKAIDKGLLIVDQVEHDLPSGMQCFVMNSRRSLFKDIRVRKALAYSFDFEWSNKQLFYDAYTRTQSYFDNSELASSGVPSGRELELLSPYREQLDPKIFTEAFKLPKSSGTDYNRPNLRIAMQLLKDAGWFVKKNKLMNEQGQVFEFEIMLIQPAFERIVNPYVKSLKKLGIQASVRHVEVSQYINRIRKFDFDMVVSSFGASLSPGNEQLEYWHSSRVNQEASRNLAGINNPVIDALVESLIAAPDREELVYRTRALDRVLLHNYYVIPQFHIGSHRVAYWNKFGQPETSPKYDGGFESSLMTWWVDPNKTKTLQQQDSE